MCAKADEKDLDLLRNGLPASAFKLLNLASDWIRSLAPHCT